METRGLQGWSADPFRLHAERYFSAGHPTKLVRDGAIEAFDEPPFDDFFPATPAGPTPRAAAAHPAGAPGRRSPAPPLTAIGGNYVPAGAPAQPGWAQPGPAQPGPAQPGPAQPGPAQPGPAQPGRAQPTSAEPGTAIQPARVTLQPGRRGYSPAVAATQMDRRDYSLVTPLPAPYGPGPASAPVGANAAYAALGRDAMPARRRRPRALLFAGAAGVVAVAVIAGVILVHDSASTTGAAPGQATAPTSTGSATSPAAVVAQAAHQTLGERAADMTLTGTYSAGGKQAAIDATGQTDFSTDSSAFDLHFRSPLGTVEEKTELVSGSEFIALTVNGKNVAAKTGQTWTQVPASQSAAANIAGRDPVASLTALEQQGGVVQAIGTKKIGGVSCTGYTVKTSKLALVAAAQTEQSELKLPAATTSQEIQQIEHQPVPVITVWVDGHDLIREMSLNLQPNVGSTVGSAQMVTDFSHFGTSVSISAPPSAATASYPAFLNSLGKSAAS